MTKEDYEKLFNPPPTEEELRREKEELTKAWRENKNNYGFNLPIQDNYIFKYLMEVDLEDFKEERKNSKISHRDDFVIWLMGYFWDKTPGFHGLMNKYEQEHFLTIEETIKLIQCFTYVNGESTNPVPHLLRYCKSHTHVNQEKFLKLLEWVYKTNKENHDSPWLLTGRALFRWGGSEEIEKINNLIKKIEITD